jgi:uncharacterized protein
MVLANTENLLSGLGEGSVEVELVVNGEGVVALLRAPGPNAGNVEHVAARGVRVLACANSMRAMDLTQETLLPAVEIVPSGAGHLVRRQAEGWAYLRL